MSDSKWAKGLQSRLLELPEGLLVTVLYAAACWSARQVSLDQFFLPAGVRVAALLVCRREMWPYLLVGDYVYLGCLRVPMIEAYGLTWVLLGSCYQFPLVAFLVHLHRRHILNGDYGWILPKSVLASITIGFGNVAAIHALWPEPESEDFATLAVRYSIGQFLAITTLTPLAILWMLPAKMRSIAPWLRAPSLLMTAMLRRPLSGAAGRWDRSGMARQRSRRCASVDGRPVPVVAPTTVGCVSVYRRGGIADNGEGTRPGTDSSQVRLQWRESWHRHCDWASGCARCVGSCF